MTQKNDPEFFTKLRKNTRWTFIAIAVILAVGFIVFGIRA